MNENLELLKSNLKFIECHAANFTFDTVSSSDFSESLQITVTEKQQNVFTLTKEGREFLLHSSRGPYEESKRQVYLWENSYSPDLSGMLVIMGFGGMYHVEEILSRAKQGATLIVMDLNPDVFKKALFACSLEKLRKKDVDVIFIVSGNIKTAIKEFTYFLKNKNRGHLSLFVHPGTERIFAEKYDVLVSEVRKAMRLDLLNKGTIAASSDEWLQNALLNLPYILRNPTVDILHGAFKGYTAVVVAAGPTLDRTVKYLSQISDKCVFICVGNALKNLLSSGIKPEFSVSIDSDTLIKKQYDGLDLDRICLLSGLYSYTDVMKIFDGRTFIFTTSSVPEFEEWLEGAGVKIPYLASGGTVALTSIDIAVYLGVEKVILCGLDLCCAEDGTTHASKTIYGNEKCGKENLVEVKGNYGKKVYTTVQFSSYIEMLNAYLGDIKKRFDVKIYNATNGGALIEKVEVIDPAEIVNLAATVNLSDKNAIISRSLTDGMKRDKEKFLEYFRSTMAELGEISVLASHALEACNVMMSSRLEQAGSGRLLGELEQLDVEIRKKNKGLLLANSALKVLFMDMKIENVDKNDTRAVLESNRRFYEHLRGASEWISGLLDISSKAYASDYQLKMGLI